MLSSSSRGGSYKKASLIAAPCYKLKYQTFFFFMLCWQCLLWTLNYKSIRLLYFGGYLLYLLRNRLHLGGHPFRGRPQGGHPTAVLIPLSPVRAPAFEGFQATPLAQTGPSVPQSSATLEGTVHVENKVTYALNVN